MTRHEPPPVRPKLRNACLTPDRKQAQLLAAARTLDAFEDYKFGKSDWLWTDWRRGRKPGLPLSQSGP
jgi:hypothetical protein